MKILKTSCFVSECIKVQPITNVELDNAAQNMPMIKEIDLDSIDISVFDQFGFILKLKSGIDCITLGNEFLPAYVKDYQHKQNMKCGTIAICYTCNSDENWSYIQKAYYNKFPKHDLYPHLEIMQVCKSNIKPENVSNLANLEDTYKKYKLHILDLNFYMNRYK